MPIIALDRVEKFFAITNQLCENKNKLLFNIPQGIALNTVAINESLKLAELSKSSIQDVLSNGNNTVNQNDSNINSAPSTGNILTNAHDGAGNTGPALSASGDESFLQSIDTNSLSGSSELSSVYENSLSSINSSESFSGSDENSFQENEAMDSNTSNASNDEESLHINENTPPLYIRHQSMVFFPMTIINGRVFIIGNNNIGVFFLSNDSDNSISGSVLNGTSSPGNENSGLPVSNNVTEGHLIRNEIIVSINASAPYGHLFLLVKTIQEPVTVRRNQENVDVDNDNQVVRSIPNGERIEENADDGGIAIVAAGSNEELVQADANTLNSPVMPNESINHTNNEQIANDTDTAWKDSISSSTDAGSIVPNASVNVEIRDRAEMASSSTSTLDNDEQSNQAGRTNISEEELSSMTIDDLIGKCAAKRFCYICRKTKWLKHWRPHLRRCAQMNKQHLRKNYSCKICKAIFMYKGRLRTHMHKMHGI